MKLGNCRYSLEGLRCLLLGSAVISEEKFRTWRKHYEKALSDLAEIDKKKSGEVNDIGNKHYRPLKLRTLFYLTLLSFYYIKLFCMIRMRNWITLKLFLYLLLAVDVFFYLDTLEDFIEKELVIAGATAIEDRLQDGVPECIERLVDG